MVPYLIEVSNERGQRIRRYEVHAANACEGAALAQKLARGNPYSLHFRGRRLISVQKPLKSNL